MEEEMPGIVGGNPDDGELSLQEIPKVTLGGTPPLPSSFEEQLQNLQHELERHKIDSVLEEWRNQQKEDRALRKTYGRVLLWVLVGELIAFTLMFYLNAFGLVKIDPVVLGTWIGALVIEVIGLVVAIAKGLFTNTTAEFLTMIRSILSHPSK